MIIQRRGSRRLPTALVGLAIVADASGCADGSQAGAGGSAAAASSTGAAAGASSAASSSGTSATASSTASTTASAEELSARLLPAQAFGPQATVATVSLQQLSKASNPVPPGSTITPASCAQDVGGLQLSPDDLGTVVAQSATSPAGVTAEVLAESPDIRGRSPHFDKLLAQCPHVTVTAANGSTVTIDFTALDLPPLGDARGGVAFTTAVRGADGTNLTVPGLLAVATDGQRMVYLQQTGANSTPLDPAAFTALFADAFRAQHGS